jgi:thiol-disulfide isomerase/thioredoxin
MKRQASTVLLVLAASAGAAAGPADPAPAPGGSPAPGSPPAISPSTPTPRASVVGKPTPEEWHIEKWFQGEGEVDLDGSKTTLLVFWELWCPHCRRELPRLQKMWDDHKALGLQVVGVTRVTRTSTDDGVRAFLSKSSIAYPVAKVDGKLAEYFQVTGIPAAALVKDGQIVWRGHPIRLTPQVLYRWL